MTPMEIRVARRAGFCMGVRRALDLALERAHAERRPVYTFGPLIHNPQVVALLEEKGVRRVDSAEALEALPPGVVVVRAHGLPPDTLARVRASGHEVVNGTCPKVQYVQGKIKIHAARGAFIVIVGDEGHPEVVGLQGFAGRHAVVASVAEAAARVPGGEPFVCVVAQTTADAALFRAVAGFLRARHPECVAVDTICDSTHTRQSEVIELARSCDTVVIVGGRESGNTRRLAECAAREGARAIAVETAEELDPADFRSARVVGLTAGASTPNWLLRAARERLDGFRLERWPRPAAYAIRLLRAFVVTGGYTALAVAGLSAGALAAAGGSPLPATVYVIPFLYTLGLFLLARLADLEAFSHNDPGRAAPLVRARRPLLAAGALALACALVRLFARLPGSAVVPALAALPVVALGALGFRGLRRVPGLKAVAAALAGASAVLAVAYGLSDAIFRPRPHPLLTDPTGVTVAAVDARDLALFLYLACVFLFRQVFLDWRDVQGDRVAGSVTWPVAYGVPATRRLLAALAAVAGAASLVMFLAGSPLRVALPFLASAFWMGHILRHQPWHHARRDPEIALDLALALPALAAVL